MAPFLKKRRSVCTNLFYQKVLNRNLRLGQDVANKSKKFCDSLTLFNHKGFVDQQTTRISKTGYLYEAARHEREEKGRRFIRCSFRPDLEKDLTPGENIEQYVKTSLYLRHVFSVKLQNIDGKPEIVFFTNNGSPWFNRKTNA